MLLIFSRAGRAAGARRGVHGDVDMAEEARRRWRVALELQEVNEDFTERPLDYFSFLQLSPFLLFFFSFLKPVGFRDFNWGT